MTFYVGTYGIPFTINTYTDMTGATPVIMVRRQDGSTATWSVDNVPGTGGTLIHWLKVTDFSVGGQYTIHWYALTSGATPAKIYGDEATIKVEIPVI
jgi:hypothetical protein